MKIPIYQADAFTSQPFKGNPAAVCLLEEPLADDRMAQIAAEMNLSETAFLLPEADGYRLRWFTPRAEVRLCGHATLASAHVLYALGKLDPTATAIFHTLSGVLKARKNGSLIELDFPVRQAVPQPPPDGLLRSLGVEAVNTVRIESVFVVEVADEEAVRTAAPNFTLLEKVETRAAGITARSAASEYDIVSRYFAPRMGVNEDPVTGSVHCGLIDYWGEKLGKTHLRAYQASPRGGTLSLHRQGERVLIGGEAVMVMEGTLHI